MLECTIRIRIVLQLHDLNSFINRIKTLLLKNTVSKATSLLEQRVWVFLPLWVRICMVLFDTVCMCARMGV